MSHRGASSTIRNQRSCKRDKLMTRSYVKGECLSWADELEQEKTWDSRMDCSRVGSMIQEWEKE